MDDGGPDPLWRVRRHVIARLARVKQILDGQIAPYLAVSNQSAPLSLGPAPQLLPQYHPGVMWIGTGHGGMDGSRSWSSSVSACPAEADPGGRTGDVPAFRVTRRARPQGRGTMTPPHDASSGARPSSRALTTLPGPRGLALLGNLLQLRATKLHTIFEQWADRLWPTLYTATGQKACGGNRGPRPHSCGAPSTSQTYRRTGFPGGRS